MATVTDARIESVRRFSRFYTKRIGVPQKSLLDSPFSLAEARILFELAHRNRPTATELGDDLGLDRGYLSRMLHTFERKALVRRTRSAKDGRESLLALTRGGRKAFARLDAQSVKAVRALFDGRSTDDQQRVVAAMQTIEDVLGAHSAQPRTYTLRPHRAGDIGWVIERHGALYAHEYGYDASFEALVAEIGAGFLRDFAPAREHGWIAECAGESVGSVFLVRKSERVAKLRLLLVEPHARGLGIGRGLVDACIAFARAAGYRKVSLWTQQGLDAARRIYENAGFRLTHEEPHHSFGHDLIAQTWELDL